MIFTVPAQELTKMISFLGLKENKLRKENMKANPIPN